MLTPRQQGDVGEMSAMSWLASRAATVAIPVGSSRDWDLLTELDGRLLRVQVKTSTCFVMAPTSAKRPSWRRPSWPGNTASSGAYSRSVMRWLTGRDAPDLPGTAFV
jgi:hypothetical protein